MAVLKKTLASDKGPNYLSAIDVMSLFSVQELIWILAAFFLSVITLLFTAVAKAASQFTGILVIFANNNDTAFA